MVGNDVVDLADVDADITTYRDGFDARVFTDGEREGIEAEVLGKSTRWQFWAAKEACFKAAKQEDPSTVFSPRAFEVWFKNRWAEIFMPVRYSGGSFEGFMVVLEVGRDYVHAMAARETGTFAQVVRSVVPCELDAAGDPIDPSTQVRTAAREAVAKQLGIDASRVDFRNEGRVPILHLDGERMDVSTSLSHHGRFLAYACEVPGAAHA